MFYITTMDAIQLHGTLVYHVYPGARLHAGMHRAADEIGDLLPVPIRHALVPAALRMGKSRGITM